MNAAQLGLGVTALIGISLSDAADHEDVANRMKDLNEIEDCWFIAGDDSFMLKVRANDVDGLERIIRRLSGTKGVSRTRTTIVLSTKWENRSGISRKRSRRTVDGSAEEREEHGRRAQARAGGEGQGR